MAEQEIFLSWSKTASEIAAEVFKEYIPQLLSGVKPWMSKHDIPMGTMWFTSISDQLSRSCACLLLITPENIDSIWLYYEAGAIAHAFKGARVFIYLIGVTPSQLRATPLSQFQMTLFEREATRKLIHDLNATLETPLPDAILNSAFDGVWPKLSRKLGNISVTKLTNTPAVHPAEPPLSPHAIDILLAATAGKDGQVMGSQTLEGFYLSAGGEQVCNSDDDRVVSSFKDALQDLVDRKLLRAEGEDSYQVTGTGYKAAEKLTPPKPAAPPITDEADILVHLQGWMHNKHRSSTRTPAISFAAVDRELNIAPGSAVKLLERAAAKLGWATDTKGTTVITFIRSHIKPR